MRLETNSNLIPIFTGTYESLWEVTEYNEEGMEEVETDYNLKDLMRSIVAAYQTNRDNIAADFNAYLPFKVKINFPGGFASPREYNFSTDCIDFDITYNKAEFFKALKALKNDAKFAEFLSQHYSSYSGFISFTPNNYADLLAEIQNEGSEYTQAVSAVFRYFLDSRSDCLEYGNGIEAQIQDYWQGNGYCGLEYTVVND